MGLHYELPVYKSCYDLLLDRNDNVTYDLLHEKNAPKFCETRSEAETWIRNEGDNRKVYTVLEVHLDEKYL
jgi:hypothetical protein